MAESAFEAFVRRLGPELKQDRRAALAWHRFAKDLAPKGQWEMVWRLYWTTAEAAAELRAELGPALRERARQRKLARQAFLRGKVGVPIEWHLLPPGSAMQVRLWAAKRAIAGMPLVAGEYEARIRAIRARKRAGQYNAGHRGAGIRQLADFLRTAMGKPPGSISLAHLVNVANRVAPDPSIPGSGGGAMGESQIRRILAVPENEL